MEVAAFLSWNWNKKMRLMISVVSVAEAYEALTGGAEILDVKNPAEGSLVLRFLRQFKRSKAFLPAEWKSAQRSGTCRTCPEQPLWPLWAQPHAAPII